jgi:hypothetical protein
MSVALRPDGKGPMGEPIYVVDEMRSTLSRLIDAYRIILDQLETRQACYQADLAAQRRWTGPVTVVDVGDSQFHHGAA